MSKLRNRNHKALPPATISWRERGAQHYTLMDELLADPNIPMRPDDFRDRVDAARKAAAALSDPATATVPDWSVCCMVGNLMESMIVSGLVVDPHGLLGDAFKALRDGAASFDAGRGFITMTTEQLDLVKYMIDDWVEVLTHAPARDVIRCYRATERRVKDLEAGRAKPCDFILKTRP